MDVKPKEETDCSLTTTDPVSRVLLAIIIIIVPASISQVLTFVARTLCIPLSTAHKNIMADLQIYELQNRILNRIQQHTRTYYNEGICCCS